jgi:uncharacterized protein (TIGR02246 family)
MKKTLMLGSLVILLSFAFSCQQGAEVIEQPVVDLEADIQAIKDIVAGWDDAVNAADLDQIVPLYADEAVEIHPDDLVFIGRDAIQAGYQQVFDQLTMQEKFVVEDVNVSQDLAVAHVTFSATNTIKDSGEPEEGSGNWIIVFKKQSDGAWKVIYSIWSEEGLVRPTQAE